MKKLTIEQQTRYDELATKLAAAKDQLEKSIEGFNAKVGELFRQVEEQLNQFNGIVVEANEFRSDVHTQLDEYFYDHSDDWQESEKGEAYVEWMETWDEGLPEVEFYDVPEDLQITDCDAVDDFNRLATNLERL